MEKQLLSKCPYKVCVLEQIVPGSNAEKRSREVGIILGQIRLHVDIEIQYRNEVYYSIENCVQKFTINSHYKKRSVTQNEL